MYCFISVCSGYFGKCYVLIPDVTRLVDGSIPSWSTIEYIVCKLYGGTLISLHTKLEQDYVGYLLLHELQHTDNEYVYIGKHTYMYTKLVFELYCPASQE